MNFAPVIMKLSISLFRCIYLTSVEYYFQSGTSHIAIAYSIHILLISGENDIGSCTSHYEIVTLFVFNFLKYRKWKLFKWICYIRLSNRIYHYTPRGTRESHLRVHDLQPTTRLAESLMSQIIDTRIGYSCPFQSVVINFLFSAAFNVNK